jgi:hypothetical protein
MNDNDIEKKAKSMWQKKEIREEFGNDYEVLLAYLQNQHRVKAHKSEYQQSTKKDAPKATDTLDDAALKARWEKSPKLWDEFNDDFDAYRQYELNKHRVKVMA